MLNDDVLWVRLFEGIAVISHWRHCVFLSEDWYLATEDSFALLQVRCDKPINSVLIVLSFQEQLDDQWIFLLHIFSILILASLDSNPKFFGSNICLGAYFSQQFCLSSLEGHMVDHLRGINILFQTWYFHVTSLTPQTCKVVSGHIWKSYSLSTCIMHL